MFVFDILVCLCYLSVNVFSTSPPLMYSTHSNSIPGAKNHGVVLPDANPATVVNALAGASCGAAGQRCMALSVAVFVGNARDFIPKIAEAAATLKVGPGHLPGTDTGPVISQAKKEHIESMIEGAVAQGAEILLDGRNPTLALPAGEDASKYKDGYYVGPTVSCLLMNKFILFIFM